MNKDITIKTGDQSVMAYFTSPDNAQSAPALIVIHEIWGLNPHTRDVADRFRKEGFVVLAPDLIKGTGVEGKVDQDIMKQLADPATRDEAQKKMRAALAPMQSPEFAKETIEKLKACFDYLASQKNVNAEQISVLGFCFGGTYSWNLAVNEPRLKSAMVFYGHAPANETDLEKIGCPVIGFYGEKDTALVEPLPKLKETMQKLGKSFDYTVYPNTGHAFFNDTRPTVYDEAATKDSFAKSLEFLRK